MLVCTLEPRFGDTDCLRHITNTTVPKWFEEARNPLFRIFNPDLSLDSWNLLLARMEVDFLAELYYGNPVEIRTWIARIGRSSVHVVQEVWQRGRPGARGLAVMVYCDPCTHKPQPVPDAVREALAEHLEVTQG